MAWWQAEGNAADIIGGNNGILENGTGFSNGEVGQAFNLNGINNFVLVNAASPTWDVGQGSGFTIEGWIDPMNSANSMLIADYERLLGTTSSADVGAAFAINSSGPGSLFANVKDTFDSDHTFYSSNGVVATGVWQHVALVYDKVLRRRYPLS